MGGGEGAKGNLKNEDGDQTGGLEPDPRYIRCCSRVCRPGYALRDALLGLLVLLGLSVVVTVIFVVCFYVVPDEKQLINDGILPGNAEGVIGGPVDVNEVTLQEGDKYSLPPKQFDEQNGKIKRLENIDTSTETFFETTDRIPSDEVFASLPPFSETELRFEEEAKQDTFLPEDHINLHNNEHMHDEFNHPNLNQHSDHHVNEKDHFLRDETTDGADIRVLQDDTTQSSRSEAQECNSVQLPMCVSSVPWTLASLPNWLNHSSEGEMFAALPYVRSSLLDSGCSSLAPLYACSVLEPPCTENGVLPPCKSFCQEVASSCMDFVQRPSLPGLFDCSRYPDSNDPSVCVSAQQECSGDDDFRCETTGLCVPSSWLCDGADDCRDNSDEQNCPVSDNTPDNVVDNRNRARRPPPRQETSYSETKEQSAEYNDEYSENNSFQGDDVPPFAYDQYDTNDPRSVNDPSIAGPSVKDPSLLDAEYGNVNNDNTNSQSVSQVYSDEAEESGKEEVFIVDEINSESPSQPQDHPAKFSSVEYNEEVDSDVQHPVLQSARPHSPSDELMERSDINDQFSDYSIRNDQFENHPIPDVDYPAKETFSVDSTSSVNENYHTVVTNKDGNEKHVQNSNEETERNTNSEHYISEMKTPDLQDKLSKTPSQRLRERLGVNTRRRQRPNNSDTKLNKKTSNEKVTEKGGLQTVTVTPRPTRPPSRLDNFQQRFREWRDRRRPTLPSEYENLQKTRPTLPGASTPSRPYDLVRRRPQRVTTPSTELYKSQELLREPKLPNRNKIERIQDNYSSDIAQPVTLPKSVVPKLDETHVARSEIDSDQEETTNKRPFNRFRKGYRQRQQQRLREKNNLPNTGEEENISSEIDSQQRNIYRQDQSKQEPNEAPTRQNVPSNNQSPEIIEPFEHSAHELQNEGIMERKRPDRYEDENTEGTRNSNFSPRVDSYQSVPSDDISESYDDELQRNYPESIYDDPNLDDYSNTDLLERTAGQDSKIEFERIERPRYTEYEEEVGPADSDDLPYIPPQYQPEVRQYQERTAQGNRAHVNEHEAYQQHVPPFQRIRYEEQSHQENEPKQLNIPNDFRVSFPPPRPNRFREQTPYEVPTGSSYYSREDAIASDLHYDVPAVNQDYPIYRIPPRNSEGNISPYARRRPS